jgi:hypothetical protein
VLNQSDIVTISHVGFAAVISPDLWQIKMLRGVGETSGNNV